MTLGALLQASTGTSPTIIPCMCSWPMSQECHACQHFPAAHHAWQSNRCCGCHVEELLGSTCSAAPLACVLWPHAAADTTHCDGLWAPGSSTHTGCSALWPPCSCTHHKLRCSVRFMILHTSWVAKEGTTEAAKRMPSLCASHLCLGTCLRPALLNAGSWRCMHPCSVGSWHLFLRACTAAFARRPQARWPATCCWLQAERGWHTWPYQSTGKSHTTSPSTPAGMALVAHPPLQEHYHASGPRPLMRHMQALQLLPACKASWLILCIGHSRYLSLPAGMAVYPSKAPLQAADRAALCLQAKSLHTDPLVQHHQASGLMPVTICRHGGRSGCLADRQPGHGRRWH